MFINHFLLCFLVSHEKRCWYIYFFCTCPIVTLIAECKEKTILKKKAFITCTLISSLRHCFWDYKQSESFPSWAAIILCVRCCAQLCLTLCSPMDSSLPGSSVHGILQARILEQVSYSRESSWARDQTIDSCISCTGWPLPCSLTLPKANWTIFFRWLTSKCVVLYCLHPTYTLKRETWSQRKVFVLLI